MVRANVKRPKRTGTLYRLAFRIKGIPALPQGTNWISDKFRWLPGVTGNVQLVGEYEKDEFGTSIPQGLRVVFEVLADSTDAALGVGEWVADSIGRIIAFQAGAPHAVPRIVALLDVTPGLTTRLYRQWCYDTIVAKPSRCVLVPELETAAFSLGQRPENERDAIMRSLKWYTDSLNERNSIDRFLKAWVGLESIGSIINRRVHKSGWQNCTKCLGDKSNRERDEKPERGIRHVFSVREPSMPDLFDRLKKARNKLVHAEWPLNRVRQEIDPLVDLTVKMLGSGLLTAMAPPGVSAGSREAFEPVPLSAREADVSVSVELLSSNSDALGELNDKLEVRSRLTASEDIDGQYKARAVYEIKGEFPCHFENMKVLPEQSPQDGIELTADAEPEHLEVHEVRPDGVARRIK